MEPRIATLLGGSSVERTSLDLLSLPPLPAAPRQRYSSEANAVGDNSNATPLPRSSTDVESYPSSKRQQTSVPIAGVLNNAAPSTNSSQPALAAAAPSTLPPFSGRLSDLILDPSQQHSNKRKRQGDNTAPSALAGPENNPLTLPKPPQLPKKSAKRPRIPPLLQGLHQPPPLPEGRLFPPITGEGGGFGRNLGERVGLLSPIRSESDKGKRAADVPVTHASQESTDDTIEAQRKDDGKVTIRSTSDKENHESTDKGKAATTGTKVKETKKRNKWSEQETKDLLVGVSRFGIGNWKKILQCSDFTFNQRTAVDLKDRFRTCCPGEGLKLKIKKSKRKSNPKAVDAQETPSALPPGSHGQHSPSHNLRASQSPATNGTTKASHTDAPGKGLVELAKFGIHRPFVKNKRRERREFTADDDENLMKGYEKHAFSWHSMRDDEELGFSSRHPTDLRDRFRIRYPEIFAKAGYKLKPKHELVVKEKEKEKEREESSNRETSNSKRSDATQQITETAITPDLHTTRHGELPSAIANRGPLPLLQPFHSSFPGPLEDSTDLASEEDLASPIVLHRKIFEWADANPSSMTSVTIANLPAVTSLMGESHLNFFNGTDGMHINPMATLNLPMALLTGNTVSAIPSHTSTPSALSRAGLQYPHNVSNPTASTATVATSTSVPKQSMNPLLRTPNLPTIVYPPVPASSARSAVHNLPPPTNLLSGLDPDYGGDSHAAGIILDESFSFTLSANASGYDPNATLAPMMSGANGRGILSVDRHMDDAAADKRV